MALCVKAKGLLNLVIDGVSIKLDADSDLEIYVSNQQREGQSNGEFTVSEKSPMITGTIRVPKNQLVRSLQELCNVPVTAELYDGRVFYLSDASNVSQSNYNAKNNTLEMELIGSFMEEINNIP